MAACKIMFVILVSCYYCRGHFIFRNYNNQQSTGSPSLNFRTFPEYFKASFRSQNLPPLSRVHNNLLQGTNINNQRAQFNQERGNCMLSMIKKILKPLMWNIEKPRWVVKKPTHGRGIMKDHYHGLHLKLIPKLVKKEVAKQLVTILGKRPTDKLVDNTRQELNKTRQEKNTPTPANDLIHKKDNISTEQPILNETSPDNIQETGYINKIEAKSIFGNFVGNKHFANIFVFYPNNNDSPLVVELKDNLTDLFTQNPAEITTKQPIDKFIDEITEKQEEENKQAEEGDNNLVENNVVDATKDNADSSIKDVIAPDETIVTTENIFKTPNFTISTTGIIPNNDNVNIVDMVTENSNEDDKHTDSVENDIVDNKDKEDDKVEDESEKTLVEKDLEPTEIITIDDNIKTTEDSIISNTEVAATTEQLYTNGDDVTGTTVVNEVTENLNKVEGGIDNEDKIEQDEFDDLVKEKDVEQTVVPATYTTEEATEESNITTEVSKITENNVEFTDVTESKSAVASENPTELSVTLTTADDENTTQFVTENIEDDFKNATTDVGDTTEDDYLEIEYTYF